ncbi:response regulator [Candidatus Poribacteria bacterium]|nr:response regulator [Candidatus Poribacteria bacterium]
MQYTMPLNDEKSKILIVDDEEMNIKLMEAILFDKGYALIIARDGQEALEKVYSESPDLILLDVRIPKINGLDVCQQLQGNDKTRFIPIIMISALDQIVDKVMGIDAGARRYMVKPIDKIELLAEIKHLIKEKHLNDHLESIENVIASLANNIEKRDAYTQGHTDRVANYAYDLAKQFHMPQEELDIIKTGGILHDIGKVGIPDAVLKKPGRLTDEEYNIIKEHPVKGYEICLSLKKTMVRVLPIIRHHHEKLDGSGYPDGLKGGQISIHARIMAIVDVYDAMTTDRPYRKGMTKEKAFQIMREEANKGWWDKEILEVFIKSQMK